MNSTTCMVTMIEMQSLLRSVFSVILSEEGQFVNMNFVHARTLERACLLAVRLSHATLYALD